MKIYENISELVGKTPIVKLNNMQKNENLQGNLFAKVEFFNPSSSVKDRIAKGIIDDAERKGLLTKDSVIIEPTSGNTGIGLASVAASRGYKIIITMPETMSVERRQLMKIFGAEIVLTDGTKGMKGAIEKANELKAEIENSFMPSQFTNEVNPKTHFETTGPEIWEDMGGNIDILVSGIGTGGTISGAGLYLKEKNPNIKIIGVEPKDSPVLTKGTPGPHKIQGIGAGFVPDTLDTKIYDEIITVSNEDAMKSSQVLAKTEGILAGISSGAALYAALLVAKKEENLGKNIVVVLPDTGERYISTDLFKLEV